MSVPYGRYEEAFKAIHSALSSLLTAPPGKKITRLEFTYNADKDVATIVAKQDTETLFTLTFVYNVDKDIESITRSEL